MTQYLKGWLHDSTQRSRCVECGRPNGRDGKPSGYWQPIIVSFAKSADRCDRCDGPMAGVDVADFYRAVA